MPNSLKSLKARPAVESVPRYQKGIHIVTRTRRINLGYILAGGAIGVFMCAYPLLLAAIERAIS